MPTPGSLASEDEAIDALMRHLTARGHSARLRSRPDRQPEHLLTVDAELDIDGVRWAVDVCAASFSPLLRPASDRAESLLRSALEPIAAAAGVGIHVQCVAQEGAPGAPWGVEYYQALIAAALALAPEGIGASRTVTDGAHVEIIDRSDANRHGVQISIWLGRSPDIAAELTRDLRTPIHNKLTGQLQRAREAGLRVGLVIDARRPRTSATGGTSTPPTSRFRRRFSACPHGAGDWMRHGFGTRRTGSATWKRSRGRSHRSHGSQVGALTERRCLHRRVQAPPAAVR